MNPSMELKGKQLLAALPINGSYMIGIYQGSLSPYDILIKYRQFENGKWSRIRTPKHIHWAVDIMIKHYCDPKSTDNLLDFMIKLWDKTCPIKNEKERNNLLNANLLLQDVNNEASKYPKLAKQGEYSVKFLILLAKLLMIQEKTNREDAYMFRQLLEQLKEHKDIFQIISTATHH